MRIRRIALAAVAAVALAVPALAMAVPASASGRNYWISADPNNTDWNGVSVANNGHNNAYINCITSCPSTSFALVGCVTVNGAAWCRMEDNTGLCMNAVQSWGGNPNEWAVVADSCVQNDSSEEWHAFGVGNDKNALENRHSGLYMNFETQGDLAGIVHLTAYRWSWSTPGAP